MADKTDAEIAAEKRAAEAEEKLKAAEADAEKWKSLSRKNEERATANAEKAKKLDELEESGKSEVDKERARAEKAEKALAERDEADQKAKEAAEAADAAKKVRTEVAKAKGVPESALRGSTKEEFEEHADELIAAGIKPAGAPSSDGQGDTGDQVSETDEKSADEIVDAVLGK